MFQGFGLNVEGRMSCGETGEFQVVEAKKFNGILSRVNLCRKRSLEKFTCADCVKGDLDGAVYFKGRTYY